MKKDINVALFHSCRKMAIEDEILCKKSMLEVLDSSTDKRAARIIEELQAEMQELEKSLKECEQDLAESMA